MRSALLLFLVFAAVTVRPDDKALTSDALIEKSRAKYSALKSYSDSGVVITEINGGSSIVLKERHTFTTYFRAPKQFFFDFKADPAASNDRFVIWINGAEVNSWWKATGVHETYPQGQGATGFALATLPTKGASGIIPPLLFSGLQSILELKDTRLAGTENIEGRRCYKITGDFAPAYANGTVTSTSPVIVWIDCDTLLIRRVFVDTPKESGPNIIDRSTTTFDPHADPDLKPELFRFAVPSAS